MMTMIIQRGTQVSVPQLVMPTTAKPTIPRQTKPPSLESTKKASSWQTATMKCQTSSQKTNWKHGSTSQSAQRIQQLESWTIKQRRNFWTQAKANSRVSSAMSWSQGWKIWNDYEQLKKERCEWLGKPNSQFMEDVWGFDTSQSWGGQFCPHRDGIK